MTDPTTHRIEHHTLADLIGRAWGENPRRHDLEAIRDSLIRFGYVQTLVVDDTSGRLVAGHGVLASLLIAQEDGLDPPERVTVEEDGEWGIPALHVALAPGEAEAYALSDTRTRELGTWDERKLVEHLKRISETTDLGLAGLGWSPSELETMIARLDGDLPDSFKELAPDAPPAGETGSKALTCPHCGQSFMP